MIRRLRFGFLSLLAAMLLAISAAGWWKFHRDLYVEEVEALKALRGAGLTVNVRRAKDAWADPPEDEETIPWNAPLVAPLKVVSIDGKPTSEQRNAALRLPRLDTYAERSTHEQQIDDYDRLRSEPPEPFDLGSLLDLELPQFGEIRLDEALLDEPLPQGEAVEDADARRIAHEIHVAWSDFGAIPNRRLVRSHKTFFERDLMTFEGERTVYIDDGDRGLWYWGYDNAIYPESLSVHDSRNQSGYVRNGGPWKRTSRSVGKTFDDFEKTARDFPRDDFPYHALNVHGHGFRYFGDAFDALPEIDLERVQKIDDVRYRVDFAPFVAERDKSKDRKPSTPDPQVVRWQTVLRSDLDWAPEEILIAEQVGNTDFESRLVQRFERIEGRVVLVERLLNDRVIGGELQERSRTRFAYKIDPEVADVAFEPATVDPVEWPTPRALPALRWYRVTFAIGLALFAYSLGRSVFGGSRRKRAPSEGSAPSAGSDVETDDLEAAPTPGA